MRSGWETGATAGDTDGFDGFTQAVDVTSKLTFQPSAARFEGTIQLRAERDGAGDGRTYHALVLDSQGNVASSGCVVVVPHDRKNK